MEQPLTIEEALQQVASLTEAGRYPAPPHLLWVEAGQQVLKHVDAEGKVQGTYRISTAAAGLGEADASFQTPRGWHEVVERYGAGQPAGVLFESRRVTGSLSNPSSTEDQISTRILRLAGLEGGYNQGPGRDSFQRYIYVHGTNHEDQLGSPASKGCIRMAEQDVIELFGAVSGHSVMVYIS